MNYYERARQLRNATVADRRYIHANAETGLDTPKTRAYVMEKLREYGLKPRECGCGVTASLGKGGGKTILLRADMDALPMAEKSGEPFSCTSAKASHGCGHDFHAAMLLTAARMLKETESELEGCVRFMFQPGEETFEGSRDMIAHGILEGVDAALAYHVSAGKMPVGLYLYNNKSCMMFSVDGFRITVTGRGSHGAYPQNAVDPINIGVHIYLALQELIARECDPCRSCVLTVGQFQAGEAANSIPETAILQGTIRTNHEESRRLLVRRMREVAEGTAAVYHGTATIEMISEVPPLICDPGLTDEIIGYMEELAIPGMAGHGGVTASASEDFAIVAEKVPSAFLYLSAGYMDGRETYNAHNPKVIFNEEVCPVGSACLAHCAWRWLQEHQ